MKEEEMQKSIRTIRDRVKEELSQLMLETCEICHYGILSKEIDRISSSFEASITEWREARKVCKNSYHKLSDEMKKVETCPDCGIALYEKLFESDT